MAQVAVTVAGGQDSAQADIATAVVKAARTRWQMLAPPLASAKVKSCKTGDTPCLRTIAADAKASHLLVVGVASLGARDHVVAVQLFDVKVAAPLFEDSAVQPAGPQLKEVAALANRLIEVDGPPLRTMTYAVTPLDGLGVDAGLLKKLDAALASEVRELQLFTIDPAAVRAQRPCAGEPKCLKDIGDKLGADRVLAGSVGLAGDELHIALKLIDVARGEEPRAIDGATPVDQAELRMRASATKLLAPDLYNKSGSITVTVPLTGAEVIVDGSSRGATTAAIVGLPPGRREVEVRYAGAKPWRAFVDLRFKEPHLVELALVDGALVEVPHGGEGPATTSADEVNVLLLSGIGALGVGVVSGVGAIVAYRVREDAARRTNDGEITRKNFDDFNAASVLCGTLTALSVTTVVVGAGLVGFSMVE